MKRYYYATVGVLGFFILFFFRQLFLHEVFFCCDNLLINIPGKLFWVEEIRHAHLPLWNPYLFSGVPFLADINVTALSPLNFLFMWLTPFSALTVSILLSFLITIFGMILLCFLLKMRPLSAMIATTIFSFSGTMIVYTGNLPMLQGVSLLPWVFSFWVLYIRQSKIAFGIVIAILMSLQLISGHPQLTYYSFLLYFLFGFVFLNGTYKRRLLQLIGIGALTTFLSGIQLVPFLELALHSTRQTMGASYEDIGALPFFSIVRFVIPTIVGNIREGTDWWQGGSVYGYTGFLTLVLAMFGSRNKKYGLFFAVITIVTFLAAFGSKSPFFWILKHTIPGVGMFRVPSNFLLISTFCISLLAGWGIEKLREYSSKSRSLYIWYVIGLSVCITGVCLFLFSNDFAREFINQPVFSFASQKISFLGISGLERLARDSGINISLIGAEILMLGVLLYRRVVANQLRLVAIIIFLDLFFYAQMGVITVPYERAEAWLNETKILTKKISSHTKSGYRYIIDPLLYPAPFGRTFGESSFIRETEWQIHTLRPNLITTNQISLIDGYGSTIYKNYQSFFETKPKDPTGVIIPNFNSWQAKELGLRYVVSNSKFSDNFSFIRSVPISSDITLYELPDSQPRIRFVSSTGKREDLNAVATTPGSIAINISATESGNVIFSETNFPGWNASVDSIKIPIHPYHTVLQSVPITSGNHVIRFWYEPASFKLGRAMTITGLVVIFCIYITKFLPRKIKERHSDLH